MTQPRLTRRAFGLLTTSAALLPRQALAQYDRIEWDDLIPRGFDYPAIIGDGFMDEVNDIWRPEWSEDATFYNTDLDGRSVRMPGYIIPVDLTAEGITGFLLVPYVGACIHVPPPPPNQLIWVTTATPWTEGDLWQAVWVEGVMHVSPRSTDLGEAGYSLAAEGIEIYPL